MSYVMTVNDELIRSENRIHPNADEYGIKCADRLSNKKKTERKELEIIRKHLHWLRSQEMTQIDLCQHVKSHEIRKKTYFFFALIA